jgi:hypothetical protein
MNKSLLALALALSALPATALAQDATAPQQPTPEQRQATHQAFEQFGQQMEQLHQQMRYQILSILSPLQRRELATLIGELAISPSPDFNAAAKRLDEMIPSGEQQRILASLASFRDQARQLHDQIRAQLESQMPAGAHQDWVSHGPDNASKPDDVRPDVGTLLLTVLTPHDMTFGMGEHNGLMMMHVEGPPPQ